MSTVKNLSDETGLTTQEVRTALENLKKTNEITTDSTNKYTVFSLNNYSFYQNSNKQFNNETTNNQQTTNKQSTTIGERKEINNIYVGDDGMRTRARETASSLVDKYWGRKATEADTDHVLGLITDFREMKVSEDKTELLKYAFECSASANALNWNYIHGVMDRLRARGIKTIDQAYGFDVKRESGG